MSSIIPTIVLVLGVDKQVSVIRAELTRARDTARHISVTAPDDRVRVPANQAADMLEQALASTSGGAEVGEKLTVALLGRTKAGKSQLVAALTGDLEGDRIARDGAGKESLAYELARAMQPKKVFKPYGRLKDALNRPGESGDFLV